MIYGISMIGVKLKNGGTIKYGYGFGNEIVPEFNICENWKEHFKIKKNRENVISEAFIKNNMNLKELIEYFDDPDFGLNETRTFNGFIRKVKKLDNNEIDAIALGIVRYDHGECNFNFRILDFETGETIHKDWDEFMNSHYFPDESCIDRAFC